MKKEGGAQVIYLTAFLPEVDERRRNVLLLQSLITKTTHNSVDKRYPILYSIKHYGSLASHPTDDDILNIFFSFMELVNQRKLVCYLFLSKLDFGRVNEEYKSLLSSQEVQVQFVQSVLRGATFMPTQFIIKSLEALPTPQNLRLVVFSLFIGQFP